MNISRREFLSSTALAGSAILWPGTAALAAPAGADALASPKYGTWGFDASGMDLSVPPGSDFNKYANGTWEAKTEIPPDRTRFGYFDVLSLLSEARVHSILEDAAAGRLKDPDAVKIGAAYRSFMDEARANKLDYHPLDQQLATIRSLRDLSDAAALMGRQNSQNYPAIFALYISQDAKAPSKYLVSLLADGLGLPDRDYYLRPSFADKKQAYHAYAQQLLDMIGWPDPAASARDIVAFETKLAEAAWTRVERRDRDKTYNPMTSAELRTLASDFDWAAFFKTSGLPAVDRFNAVTNTAFPKYAGILAATPLPTLKAWFAFRLVDGAAPYLSPRFVDANFEFRSKTLAGQPQQRDRWKRAVTFVGTTLGESVGRVYVARYFPPEAKAKMDALVANINAALKARIEKLDWMAPETKVRALEKLTKFTVKIGYPAKWRNYDAYQVGDDLLANRRASGAFEWRRQTARLFEAVDRAEWGMTPQTVNAYYSSTNNEIVFPAAILQPPFFDPDADPAINYGGIGAVIGHEISHGFDDQGRKSNGDGVLADWWTEADAGKFKSQATRLGAQYGAFEPLPGSRVNGDLTMGENIGDMGGLSLALDAYRTSLGGRAAPVLDGFTGEQRVFLSWAQVWRQKMRDDSLRQQVVSDPHSPARYRVNGTVRNVEGWYDAFSVKPGDALYVAPQDRVRIW